MKIRFYTSDALFIESLEWQVEMGPLPQAIRWRERGIFIQASHDFGAYYQAKREFNLNDHDFRPGVKIIDDKEKNDA